MPGIQLDVDFHFAELHPKDAGISKSMLGNTAPGACSVSMLSTALFG
jgi:hypothetical protein